MDKQIKTRFKPDTFPEQWIGRNGPVASPASSPDLNPCDFFLLGYVKDLVYASPINSLEMLRSRIENAAVTIRNNKEALGQIPTTIRKRAQCSVLGQNSTGQSTSTTLRNPSLAHKHDSAGLPVI
jgi:hypothetical protein